MSFMLDAEQRAPAEMHNRVHLDSDGRVIFESVQDVEPILESNREKRRIDDGYTKDRTMKRVGRIPLVMVEKIMREKGWNPLHPSNSERLLQLLDDPDYSHFKTSDGRAARSVQRHYYRGSASTKLVRLGDE